MSAWDKENVKPECILKPSARSLLDAAYQRWCEDNKIATLIACGMNDDYLNKESGSHICVKNEEGTNLVDEWLFFHDAKGEKERRVFKRDGGLLLDSTSPVYLEWRKSFDLYTRQHEEVERWRTKRNDYRTEIEAVLASVNTTKQLLEAWPEVEKYIPDAYADPSRIRLPAIMPTLPKGE